ncbi:MAG: hypothetical protein WDZ39_00730 [Candidatus Spechtbacterales bacterium]
MNKKVLSLLIVVSVFSMVFMPASFCGSGNIADAQVRNLISPWPEGTTLTGVLEAICWNLLVFTVPVFVIMIIIGGYYYMFGGANPQRISTGKKTLLYGFLGFFILLFACVIPTMLRNIF